MTLTDFADSFQKVFNCSSETEQMVLVIPDTISVENALVMGGVGDCQNSSTTHYKNNSFLG